MGNRAASRLVMVSGISEEFWGGKERTRAGYADLCCALVPGRPTEDPAGLRGSTAVALGRRSPAAGPLWSPELGLRHRQRPGWEKQTCLHPSFLGLLQLPALSLSGREKPCLLLHCVHSLFYPAQSRAPGGSCQPVPICAHHMATALPAPLPSRQPLGPHLAAGTPPPHPWAPLPRTGGRGRCAPSPAPCSLRADTGTQHPLGRPAAGAVMQSGSMEALAARDGKPGQDHGAHGPGYRAAGSSEAPPGAPGTNNSKKPGSGCSPLPEALRCRPGAPCGEVSGHREGGTGAPAGDHRVPAAPRCLPRPPRRARPQRAARNRCRPRGTVAGPPHPRCPPPLLLLPVRARCR